LHFLSGGAVAFARGLNDTPKIAGLMVVSNLGAGRTTLVAITGAMLLGGWLSSRKVAETMSHRITGMDRDEGLAGNLVTAFLVLLASKAGFPVSTTHVSCGAIFGIGAVHGHARWKVILGVFLAWIGTLPMAGLITSGLCYLLK
jgi:PiT family inorganic phosphate transporter